MSDKNEDKGKSSSGIHIAGNVGPGSAIGRGTVHATHIAGRDLIIGAKAKEVTEAFAQIYAAIEAKKFPKEAESQETREAVELIEEENNKGDEANEKLVRISLKTLLRMAPDIWEVAVNTFTNPLLGISTVVKMVAEKAKEEAA